MFRARANGLERRERCLKVVVVVERGHEAVVLSDALYNEGMMRAV